MSEQIQSQYMSDVDELILRAAAEIMRRTGESVIDNLWDANKTTAEILNIGGLRERLTSASDELGRVLIGLKVNAESYPAAPEPQSLRA